MEEVTIASINCQGLGGKEKRKDVLNYLKQKKFAIYCLQDTHFTEKEENYIRAQWGYECFFSSHNSQSRGVAILLNNNFEFKLHKIKKDLDGNKIILDISILNKRITLINIYGPNRDCPNFYESVKQNLQEFENDDIIITGDFNLVMDPETDTKHYCHINNPRAREKVVDICSEFSLIDIWRELHMETSQYTWRPTNGRKQARLDFFLISENLFTGVKETNILPGYRSDHSMITLKFRGSERKKNKLFWKFNNSLLKDKEYIKTVKEVIENVKKQYLDPNEIINEQDINDINNSEMKFSINDQLFFEVLLMEIRGKTISYSCHKKKTEDKTEKKLISEIEALEKDNDADINIIASKKAELQELRAKRLESLKIRSRAKWIDEGEKATKYFCNLENRNYVSKNMPHLWKSDGTKTVDEKDIITEKKSFYENLYKERPINDINIEETLNFADIPKLSEFEWKELEGMINKEEILASLKNMKNNKSPGSDGFTAEFFKFFWLDLGDFIVRSLNYGYQSGELSTTQKEGVITCIPKGGKDKQHLKNWRPISLLNVIYKLASACIANRIKKVLNKLINEDQTGFIAGRYIGENIRNLYDLLHYTEKNKIPGLLLLIDFEKAFDSVAWPFIYKVLDYFNFGPSIKCWIKVFYNNIKSCVVVNGEVSSWFRIFRGCRQGDPLSPYIFILCAEILALMIRKNNNIKGITVGDKEFLVGQYADDTSLTLDGTEISLKYALKVLKFYADASGLHINMDKTRLIWFGSLKGSSKTLFSHLDLCWDQGNFKLLGVEFCLNLNKMIKINYQEKLREIRNLLIQWSKRILTPYGRITVVKSLAVAKINHLFLTLPNPPENIIKELNSLFFRYIWNGSIDKIKRDVSIKKYADGGLKILKIEDFIDAMKLSWIRRIVKSDSKWKYLLELSYPNTTNFANYGSDFMRNKMSYISNKFWTDTFQAWINFSNKIKIKSWTDFLKQPIWYNINVKVGGKSILYKKWFEKGIVFIYDIIDSNGNFLTFDYIYNILRIQTNIVEYQGLIRSITMYRERLKISQNVSTISRPDIPTAIKLLLWNKKGGKLFYQILTDNQSTPTSQGKWQNELNIDDLYPWKKIYSLPYKLTNHTNIRWFQYRLTHRILSTNKFLTKIGIKQDSLCSFCKLHPETLSHIFWNCDTVKNFWNNLTDWLTNNFSHIVTLNFTLEDILFGIHDFKRADDILNLLLILAKQFIYRMKCNNSRPVLQHFIKTLHFYYNSEKYVAFTNCNWKKFNKKWLLYKHIFSENPTH